MNTGERSDLNAVAAAVAEHKEMREVAAEHPVQWIKFNRGIRELHKMLNPAKARGKPKTVFVFGPSGCGKSRWAHRTYPNACVISDNKGGWLDGYEGEDTIIFDDFEGLFPIGDMKRLVDWHKTTLWIKGSSAPIRATTFIFTSNKHPAVCYAGYDADPFVRRLQEFGDIIDCSTDEGKAFIAVGEGDE